MDISTVLTKPPLLRTRSYSLDSWLNGMEWPENSPSRFIRASQLANPGPIQVFTFLDEEEHSIEDGHFAIMRSGINQWENMPADRHSRGCVLSYADGHSARIGWLWPKKLKVAEYAKPTANAQDLADFKRLQNGLPVR